MTRLFKCFLCVTLCASFSFAAKAVELSFSRHYSDNMVLQRDKPVLVRGFAGKGAEVIATFAGQTQKAKADGNGVWAITFDAMPVNKVGAEIRVTSEGASKALKNVLVGDVFLFARQSSIDVRLGKDSAGKKVAADYNENPLIRVMMIDTLPALEPQQNLDHEAVTAWGVLNKKSALEMNAAAFYAMQDVSKEADVPIGMIDLDMGYHFPIAWLSKDALLETGTIFGRDKMVVEANINSIDHMFKVADQMLELLEDEEKRKEMEKRKCRQEPFLHPTKDARFPAAGYNAVLHPMQGLALKGVLLQLGNNYPYFLYEQLISRGKQADRAYLDQVYAESYELRKWGIYLEPITTPRIPREWRRTFGDDSVAYGWITPPGSDLVTSARHHREMRELQRRAAEAEEGVELILAGTEHIPFSAQPADEPLLGKRCAAWIKGMFYSDKEGLSTGPILDRAEISFSEAQLFFKAGTARGLKASGGALDLFEVAGADLDYRSARAVIDGETIRLSSEDVSQISHIRYNWVGKPDQRLVNAAGLPAVPFMTAEHNYPIRIDTKGEEILPEEFSLPISEWKNEGAIVLNNKMSTDPNKAQFWLGPTGLRVSQFGPNLYVNGAYVGSPADGKILSGDFLYGVNGKLFTGNGMEDIAAAITQAETEEGQGKVSFDLMRDGNKLSVELTLEVLGTYSATAPYNCPKTDRIVANAEKYLAARGGG